MAGMAALTITKREHEVMTRAFTILRDDGTRVTDVGYWGPADPTLIGARRSAGASFLAAGGRYYVTDGDRNGASVHEMEHRGAYFQPKRIGTLLIGAVTDGWQALEAEPRPRRRATRKPAAASRPAAVPVAEPVAEPVAAPLEPVAYVECGEVSPDERALPCTLHVAGHSLTLHAHESDLGNVAHSWPVAPILEPVAAPLEPVAPILEPVATVSPIRPDVDTAAPVTAAPYLTREGRKAANRALAAAMRAAGLEPRGEAWERAKRERYGVSA